MRDRRKLVTDYLADRINAVHGNLVWGTYHENHHESKKESRTGWTTVDRRYVCTQVGGVFVGRRPPTWLRPPACKNSWKQSVTHTLSRFAALWRKNLNRHLKSLSKERKKSRKSSAKGQERKIGVEKGEYLALDWGRETSLKNHLKSLKESPRNDEKRKKESGGREGVYVHVCV